MKNIFCFVVLSLLTVVVWGQTISYDLSAIPDSIKKKADVVVQFEKQVFSVEDIDKASLYVHKIYTVTNEDGKHELDFFVATSKFISLDNAELKVFDALGRLVLKHKK